MNAWIAAARLRTLPAAAVPVAVGTACAHAAGHVAWGPALAALGGSLAIQIGTNFANDVFDAEKGADGPDRLGPLRAVSAGLITASAMKRAMVLAFLVAAHGRLHADFAERVQFVDEDDAGRLRLRLPEQIAHAGGAHADEHLDEFRSAEAEEGHLRLAGDGAREQRLAGARRTDEQHAFGNAAAG